MKFPKPLLNALKEKKIICPTVVQMQGIPVALVLHFNFVLTTLDLIVYMLFINKTHVVV